MNTAGASTNRHGEVKRLTWALIGGAVFCIGALTGVMVERKVHECPETDLASEDWGYAPVQPEEVKYNPIGELPNEEGKR